MKEFIQLKNELKQEGVYGFSFHENGFHVDHEILINEPHLQIKSRITGGEYPYEIYVEHAGFKVYAIIRTEQLKKFPQFKEQAKAKLLKQLAELDQGEEVGA